MSRTSLEAIDNILSRRSIRRFDPSQNVDNVSLKTILECACAAPSASNYHPWHFIVIDSRETLDSMADLHPYGKMLKSAPLAIAVCSETERDGKVLRYWEEDCSAAMQNILLSANALGFGSVWLGAKRGDNDLEGKLKSLLNVPTQIALMGIAAIGRPLETKDPHKGIDPHSLHSNKW